jgi:flagellar assembly protein FliH
MSRIPAHRVAQHEARTVSDRASTRILKSKYLAGDRESVLVSVPEIGSRSGQNGDHSDRRSQSEIVREALQTAERNFERRLAAGIEQAREAAYSGGFAEGQAAASTGLVKREADLNQAIAGFRGAWESFAERSEPLIAELGFRLAEAILESPLPDQVRTLSMAALSDAVEKIGESDPIQVTVHPADFMALTEGGLIAQIGQNHPGLSWRTDVGLDRGDWEVRSNAAVIRRVALEMLADTRERLRNSDSTDSRTD